MIKLFITDLDGCMSFPFQTPHWESIQEIRKLNIESRNSNHIPPLTICTGRPFPYAEAVAQWLDIRLPFVFESAGVYHWDGNRIETALDDSKNPLEDVRAIRRWLSDTLLPNYPDAQLEFTKMMDAGVVCPDEPTVNEIYEKIKDRVEEMNGKLEIHTTEISVNVLVAGNNKRKGVELLGKNLNVEPEEMAYIGDTSGDVVALKHVKLPFAPSNARIVAKDVSTVLPYKTTEAVLEAYRRVIAYNKEFVEAEV